MVIWFFVFAVIMFIMAGVMIMMALNSGSWKDIIVVLMFLGSGIGFLYAGYTYEWVGPMYKYVEMVI